jgi:hypothetical protein
LYLPQSVHPVIQEIKLEGHYNILQDILMLVTSEGSVENFEGWIVLPLEVAFLVSGILLSLRCCRLLAFKRLVFFCFKGSLCLRSYEEPGIWLDVLPRRFLRLHIQLK